jgi:hypothetical protein
MRIVTVVAAVAVLAVGAGLIAQEKAKKEEEKLTHKQLVLRLDHWVKKQEKAGSLDEESRKEVRALADALLNLTAKQVYDGLSEEERKELLELIEKDRRERGYAETIGRVADDVGLDAEQTEKLLDLYAEYREEVRKVWRDREAREKLDKKWESDLTRLLGRQKSKAVQNALRRAGGRWGRGGG